MSQRMWNSRFIRIFIISILLQTGNQIIMTILPLYLDALHLEPSVLTTGHALSALAAMAGAPLAGALADRRGKGLVLIAGMLTMAAGMIGFAVIPYVLPIIAIRLVQGFGISAASVSQTAIAADVLPKEKMKSGLSYFGIAGTIAGAAGAFIGARLVFGDNYSWVWIGGTAIFMAGAAIMLTLRGMNRSTGIADTKQKLNIRSLIEKTALLPGLIQLILMVAGAAMAFLSTYGVESGVTDYSLYFTFQAVASLAATLLMGSVMSKVSSPKWVFVGGTLLCAMAFLALFTMGGDFLYYTSGVLYGLGSGVCTAAVSAISMANAPEERRGAAAATFTSMGSLGYSLGSLAWGFVVPALGYRLVYGVAALLPVAALLLSLFAFRGASRTRKSAARRVCARKSPGIVTSC